MNHSKKRSSTTWSGTSYVRLAVIPGSVTAPVSMSISAKKASRPAPEGQQRTTNSASSVLTGCLVIPDRPRRRCDREIRHWQFVQHRRASDHRLEHNLIAAVEQRIRNAEPHPERELAGRIRRLWVWRLGQEPLPVVRTLDDPAVRDRLLPQSRQVHRLFLFFVLKPTLRIEESVEEASGSLFCVSSSKAALEWGSGGLPRTHKSGAGNSCGGDRSRTAG